jgi:hypothetical protein
MKIIFLRLSKMREYDRVGYAVSSRNLSLRAVVEENLENIENEVGRRAVTENVEALRWKRNGSRKK